MEFRVLTFDEIDHFRDLDRREIVKEIYRHRDGELVSHRVFHDVPHWTISQQEEFISHIKNLYQRGGTVIGTWNKTDLVGMITLDSRFLGKNRDLLNLNGLWVSRDYRNQGVATRLFELLVEVAKDRGAKGLYVSATPSRNTIRFYQHKGFELAETTDPELFELEPEDIHMTMRF